MSLWWYAGDGDSVGADDCDVELLELIARRCGWTTMVNERRLVIDDDDVTDVRYPNIRHHYANADGMLITTMEAVACHKVHRTQ